MSAYDIGAFALFVVLAVTLATFVYVMSRMPTTSFDDCPDGCNCRGQLSPLDHRDGLRKTP